MIHRAIGPGLGLALADSPGIVCRTVPVWWAGRMTMGPGIDLASPRAIQYAGNHVPTVATVKHVQKDVENDRFYAEAGISKAILALTVFLALVAFAFSDPLDQPIGQTKLKGELGQIQLFLNQPLQIWVDHLGAPWQEKNLNREWRIGRFQLDCLFSSHGKADLVFIKALDGKPDLTLSEATKIMNSLGWVDPKEEDDHNYVEWGDTDKTLYAHYDKEDRELMIQTMVYLRDE
jgi:hypothetical protein